SELFREIMGLGAYYPTRAEQRILERHAAEITAPLAGRACTVVDLGAGDGAKTRLLLDALCGHGPPPCYAPVDLSGAALAQASGRMASAFPGMEIVPVEADYLQGLRALGTGRPGPLLVLFLGSNVGNLERAEAARFLRSLRRRLRPGDHVLVGLDLVKDPATLHAAYDDAAGVTAAFNLNLLERINRELGGDLDVRAFEHVATFDPARPAMESWLRSRRRQRVRVAGRCFSLEAGERIHTEISCKYREGDIDAFARHAGFEEVGRHRDRSHRFADAVWRVGAPR
ncbi:MAG TPA: L-histidine N(alpha)-methyltransferase, partial [Anaeromyxobacteraceae bacterium]|nr:L-histidine N(alpha)-methyltransferase [Anaeromyxobacteraceae bacterium]